MHIDTDKALDWLDKLRDGVANGNNACEEIVTHAMDAGRLRKALKNYVDLVPFDLNTPEQTAWELRAILGAPHPHRSSTGNSDECWLCGKDLRDRVHVPPGPPDPPGGKPPPMKAA